MTEVSLASDPGISDTSRVGKRFLSKGGGEEREEMRRKRGGKKSLLPETQNSCKHQPSVFSKVDIFREKLTKWRLVGFFLLD